MDKIKTASELIKIARELIASNGKFDFNKEAYFYEDEPNKWLPKDPHDTVKGQVDVEISGSFDIDEKGYPKEADLRKAIIDEFKSLEKDLFTPKTMKPLEIHVDYDGNEKDGFYIFIDAVTSYRFLDMNMWSEVLKKHGFEF